MGGKKKKKRQQSTRNKDRDQEESRKFSLFPYHLKQRRNPRPLTQPHAVRHPTPRRDGTMLIWALSCVLWCINRRSIRLRRSLRLRGIHCRFREWVRTRKWMGVLVLALNSRCIVVTGVSFQYGFGTIINNDCQL